MGLRRRVGRSRRAAAWVASLAAIAGTPACDTPAAEAASPERRQLRDALTALRASGTYTMTGTLRSPDGSRDKVAVRRDGKGDCVGTIGGADGIVIGGLGRPVKVAPPDTWGTITDDQLLKSLRIKGS
ncbi:hypothetical protein ACIO3O_35275 [Streptomyces sp. NPDC087440]|uniref:hypothetical protein n=1 Tax=Streptomyces sp. NPDC087440 TaxID=3365790 RepID=UPI0037F5856F